MAAKKPDWRRYNKRPGFTRKTMWLEDEWQLWARERAIKLGLRGGKGHPDTQTLLLQACRYFMYRTEMREGRMTLEQVKQKLEASRE